MTSDSEDASDYACVVWENGDISSIELKSLRVDLDAFLVNVLESQR